MGIAAPLSAWQYVILQNADNTPRSIHELLGRRAGYNPGKHRISSLVEAGYLTEHPRSNRRYYTRAPDGDTLATQLRAMADRLGWVPE